MIGTASIVAMISLSLGLKENAVKGLESWGNLTEMEVHPAYFMPDDRTEIPPDQRKQLNKQAVQELKAIPGVEAVMPTKQLYSQTTLKVGRRQGDIQLIGVDVREAALMKKKDIEKGEFLNGPNNEIVISYEVSRQLRDVEKERREERKRRANARSGGGQQNNFPIFRGGGGGNEQAAIDTVGKSATLVLTRQVMNDNDEPAFEKKEIRVRIVGQLQKEENNYYGPTAYVPMGMIDELNNWLNAKNDRNDRNSGKESKRKTTRKNKDDVQYDSINLKVSGREYVESVVEGAQKIGYEIYSPARQLKEINKFFSVVQLILGGIAAISLLVATIGIVNTMIMSILERTKEIGIMKVIGATVYNIRWLFLIESGFIGLIGGVAGLGIAYGAVSLLNYLGKDSSVLNMFGGPMEGAETQLAVVPIWLALTAIGFSFVVGLLAGIFPAFRASRLSPLQAIRSE